jgi:hypothetical protein
MVEAAGGAVVDGGGDPLMFNRPEIRHRGVVAANKILTHSLQGLWAAAMSEKL